MSPPSYPVLPPFTPFEMTFQKMFWDVIKPGAWIKSDVCNASQIFRRVEGPFDLEALKRALDALVERHNILGAHLVLNDDVPCVAYGPAPSVAIEQVDLSALGESAAYAKALEVLADRMWSDIPTERGFTRLVVITLGETHHIVAWVLHHLICDAQALNVLNAELDLFYCAFRDGAAPPALPRAVQYVEYCAGLTQWLATPAAAPAIAYWREQTRGVAATQLPDDFAAGAMPSQGAHIPVAIDDGLRAELMGFCRANNVTLGMVLLCAQAVALWEATRAPDVTISVVTAGRDQLALEGIVGLLAVNLPHRIQVAKNRTLREVLRTVRDVSLDARENATIPGNLYFELLAQSGGSVVAPWFNFVPMEPGQNPLAPIPHGSHIGLGTPSMGPRPTLLTDNAAGTMNPYGIHLFGGDQLIAGLLSFSTGRYRLDTIVRFLRAMDFVLRRMVAAPDETVGAVVESFGAQ